MRKLLRPPNVCILSRGADEDYVVRNLMGAQETAGVPPDLAPFLTRCFITRVRCLLDSKSGFLVSRRSTHHIITCL